MRRALIALPLLALAYCTQVGPAGAQNVPELYAANAYVICTYNKPTGCDVFGDNTDEPVPYEEYARRELKRPDAILVGIADGGYRAPVYVYVHLPKQKGK